MFWGFHYKLKRTTTKVLTKKPTIGKKKKNLYICIGFDLVLKCKKGRGDLHGQGSNSKQETWKKQ